MYVTIVYNELTQGFTLETNIGPDEVNKFIIDWLKTDIGKEEKDNRPLIPQTEYMVSIYKDKFGNWEVEDNCCNSNVRRGLLGYFIVDYKRLKKERESA